MQNEKKSLPKFCGGQVRPKPACATPRTIRAYALFARFFRKPSSSLAKRSAVRFLAAASEAFFARADRCAGVMFCAAVFPPFRPNLRAISFIAARTSKGILISRSYT
jgi:hypothetical protein